MRRLSESVFHVMRISCNISKPSFCIFSSLLYVYMRANEQSPNESRFEAAFIYVSTKLRSAAIINLWAFYSIILTDQTNAEEQQKVPYCFPLFVIFQPIFSSLLKSLAFESHSIGLPSSDDQPTSKQYQTQDNKLCNRLDGFQMERQF